MYKRQVEQRPFFLAEQETGAAGDRGAGDRAEQMADDAAADARIEDDRHLADGRLAGVQPRDGAGSGARADFGGAFEVGQMMRACLLYTSRCV